MNTAPITIWRPELVISAEATGLFVAVKAAPSTVKPVEVVRPKQPRQYCSRR